MIWLENCCENCRFSKEHDDTYCKCEKDNRKMLLCGRCSEYESASRAKS